MRIRIDDNFDGETELQYSSVDNESVVGNGVLGNDDVKIIEVETIDAKFSEECIHDKSNNKCNVTFEDNTLIQNKNNEEKKVNNKFSLDIRSNEELYNKKTNEDINDENIKKDEKKNNSKSEKREEVKGKITVTSRLGSENGTLISSAKINLYALNGISPKLVSSKTTNEDGVVVYDNLSQGSYRVIAIVDKKYFEKPVYIDWNEVTINKDFNEKDIVVINKIKTNAKR